MTDIKIVDEGAQRRLQDLVNLLPMGPLYAVMSAYGRSDRPDEEAARQLRADITHLLLVTRQAERILNQAVERQMLDPNVPVIVKEEQS